MHDMITPPPPRPFAPSSLSAILRLAFEAEQPPGIGNVGSYRDNLQQAPLSPLRSSPWLHHLFPRTTLASRWSMEVLPPSTPAAKAFRCEG